MPVVDAHCHASLAWYEPVEMLVAQLERNGVQHAVLVQILGHYDNEYQFECVERFPDRLVSVVAVDPAAAGAPAALARLAERGARGVRLRASTASASGQYAVWATAAELGLPVTCNGSASEFASADFAVVVEGLPELPVVIEHLGRPTGFGADADDELRTRVFALARFPNTYVKIHGLGEFAQRAMPVTEPFPFEEPIPPALAQAYAAFGAERMLWGSDYPPVSGREGYANALRLTREQFAHTTADERESIFGGTAARLYGIG